MGWPETVIPLAGMLTTLVGTFAGIFAGIRTERARWEREQRTRFHPDRYAKYTQFLASSNNMLFLTPQDATEERRLYEAIGETYAHIQLLASKPVQEAAEVYLRVSLEAKFPDLVAESMDVSPETLTRDIQDVEPLRTAFIEAARKELGITSESLR